jgi:hypothetical protein
MAETTIKLNGLNYDVEYEKDCDGIIINAITNIWNVDFFISDYFKDKCNSLTLIDYSPEVLLVKLYDKLYADLRSSQDDYEYEKWQEKRCFEEWPNV